MKSGFLVLSALMFLSACSDESATLKIDPVPDEAVVTEAAENPAPNARQVYWGDTHLHTSMSQDAFTFGVSLGAEEAYRFARGEKVSSTFGLDAQLTRPLDFLVVADHAEGLGAMDAVMAGDPRLMSDPILAQWREKLQLGTKEARVAVADDGRERGWPAALNNQDIRRSAWERQVAIGDKYNEPGRFTALLGYEWTSWPGGSNLHRVVVFRDGADRAGQILPFSRNDSPDPEDLWRFLGRYEADTGGQALAIPHNGNISNGLLFDVEKYDGETPIDADYATRRARWEPLAEVTQIKGDGETHPFLSPNDEFADYETWDKINFMGVPKTEDMLEFEYARSALRNGIALGAELGVNPFKFGMIGSTDSHTGLATADEDNFFGKHSGGMEPEPDRWQNVMGKSGETTTLGWEQASSGYAAIWADENTREALFDAMRRKETYATTGTRMTVRFFGGWDFEESDSSAGSLVEQGYARGVPMGGDLPEAEISTAPVFMVAAMKDPLGANLDRVQIVKGWVDANSETHEQVHDVVWSNAGQRQIDDAGRLTPVGSTVDLEAATYTNDIGAVELRGTWRDPDFDKEQHAFYYVRVLEIPTPRWTAYDAVRYGLELPDHVPVVGQERAYTSPIWYTPG